MHLLTFFIRFCRIATAALILLVGLSVVSQWLSVFGVHVPVASFPEVLQAMMTWLLIALTLMMSIVFGFGYFVLTGLRQRTAIPWPLRIFLAFLLGIVVCALAIPISLIIPLPLVPTILSALALWGSMRVISTRFSLGRISAEEAIRRAKAAHKKLLGGRVLSVERTSFEDGNWLVELRYKSDEGVGLAAYELDSSGEVRRVVKRGFCN